MRDLVKAQKDSFEDFFDNLFNQKGSSMKTDIKETEKHYRFIVDLPGMKKENIKVHVADGYLNIEASAEGETETKDERFIRKERHFGSVMRRYYVGSVKTEDLKASYKNGTLEVTVPKVDQSKVETKYLDIK